MSTGRKGTIKNKKATADMASLTAGNFWDLDNYQKCVKRINETSALCDDLVKMYSERADIESKYGKRLDEWHDKWSKSLEQSCMYATMKTAALGTLKEAQDRAKIHIDCCMKLQNQVIETIKHWKESNYHHKILGIKEAKDFEQDFAKAQKPWAVAYNKVQRGKNNYHNASRQRDACQQNFDAANKDSEMPIDKTKKLEDALRKAENNVSTMQQKYDEKLKRISPLNISYECDMQEVYDRWQKGEEKRKEFFQRILVDFHKSVNIYSDNRLKELFENQLNVAYSGKGDYDVKWWAENFGAGMPKNWPKFEEPGEIAHSENHLVTAVQPSVPQSYSSNSIGSNQQPPQQYAYQESVQDQQRNPFMDEQDNGDDDWEPPAPIAGGGIPVRALYDYSRVEDDELSFNAGDVLTKLTEEDEQGWCRGRINGQEGLYPANYVESI